MFHQIRKGITFRNYSFGCDREDAEVFACEIKQNAFYGCSNIKSVVMYTVPDSYYTTDERGYPAAVNGKTLYFAGDTSKSRKSHIIQRKISLLRI